MWLVSSPSMAAQSAARTLRRRQVPLRTYPGTEQICTNSDGGIRECNLMSRHVASFSGHPDGEICMPFSALCHRCLSISHCANQHLHDTTPIERIAMPLGGRQ